MPTQSYEPLPIPLIGPCDALLVLPPFAGIDRPALGLHVLQACAKAAGFRVRVLYANLLLAAELGYELYEAICYAPTADLLGERICAPAAGFRPTERLGRKTPFRTPVKRDPLASHGASEQELQDYLILWTERIAEQLATIETPVIGLNSTFEQTACALAIIKKIKDHNPLAVTLIGGANCEGQMGNGIADLAPEVDHVFSGESETIFVKFLRERSAQLKTSPRVLVGKPCDKLEDLPIVDYTDYYQQLRRCQELGRLPDTKHVWLPYEGSRGCWWGQKHHCTFCGINGQGMGFREKTGEKVASELEALLEKHVSEKVLMVDNIMPTSYFGTLLPILTSWQRPLHIFYEQKSNLSLRKVKALRSAGIAVIQPGIEALSSSLLSRMRKGVKAYQNLGLLRYARSCALGVNWNLLYAFPGDEERDYEETIALIRKIPHLHPPTGVCHLSIDRFSPYFDRSSEFGITNVRPMDSYFEVFPPNANHFNLGYHFVGDYDCAHKRAPQLIAEVESLVAEWRRSWMSDRPLPALAITQLSKEEYLLADSRGGACRLSIIDNKKAGVALRAQHKDSVEQELLQWAIGETEVAVEMDGLIVPLATAGPELLEQIETGECFNHRVSAAHRANEPAMVSQSKPAELRTYN